MRARCSSCSAGVLRLSVGISLLSDIELFSQYLIGKRLFRIWLCMPLREISSINDRLDAVEDILNHPSFESQFADVAKGLPDLERIVARIHAKSCKIKDFLKVLSVRGLSYLLLPDWR